MSEQLPDVTIKVVKLCGGVSMGVLISGNEQFPTGDHQYTPHSKLQEVESKNTALSKAIDKLNVAYIDLDNAHECLKTENASLKQQLSVALEALKIGHDCAIKLTDFDEIPLADRRYSGIEVIARAIQQIEGKGE